ncbi:MAG: hypothetical protein ACTSYR_03920 [Candidatus Odinarchaeia archaeon]
MWRILRPDAAKVWKNPQVKTSLNWYYKVLKNERPAKYLICKKIPANISLSDSTLNLLKEHSKLSIQFKKLLKQVDDGKVDINKIEKPEISYLDVKLELSKRIMRNCHLCEHRCNVNRLGGQKGFCGVGAEARVSSFFLHTGEEAPLIPSGTIFFSGCNFRCAHYT